MTSPCLLFFPLLLFFVTADIIQIQVVHRHGARNHLVKDPIDPSQENRSRSGGLLPGGIIQLANLADFIYNEYIDEGAPSRIKGVSTGGRFRPDIVARSSNLHRTLISSRIFLNELYKNNGEGDTVPIFVYDSQENDWRIRGYTLCPRLTAKLEDFANSDEYKQKDDDKAGTSVTNAEFIQRLASKLPELGDEEEDDHSLKHVFNVYDRFLIIKNEGYGHLNYQPEAEKLGDDDFVRLKGLADWYESSRFDFATHNLHVAGGLMADIMEEMQRAHEGDTSDSGPQPKKIVEYSGHYPTLLTLLASLREGSGQPRQYPADEIPGFGAALVFELHTDDNGAFVRLKWFEGDDTWQEDEAHNITLSEFAMGSAPCAKVEDRCSLDDFGRLLADITSEDPTPKEVFCAECESEADACVALRASEGDICSARRKVLSGFIGTVVGLVGGVLIALGYMNCRTRRKQREPNIDDGMLDDSAGTLGNGTAL